MDAAESETLQNFAFLYKIFMFFTKILIKLPQIKMILKKTTFTLFKVGVWQSVQNNIPLLNGSLIVEFINAP